MRPERQDVSKKKGMFDNLEGRLIGEITILYPIETPEGIANSNRAQYYWAQCSCGKEYAVSARTLKRKKRSNSDEYGATACKDCAHKLRIAKFRTPHGLSRDRIYKLWTSMKARCAEENGRLLHGGRGIRVCEEWNREGKEGFLSFYAWSMDNNYQDDLTLDRIDVNGNYEPGNCQWVTVQEQNYNKQNTIYIDTNGEKTSLSQYYYSEPDRLVPYQVVSNRFRQGWTLEEIFTTPFGERRDGKGSILKKEKIEVPVIKPEPAPISPKRKDWSGAQLGLLDILYPIATPDYIKDKYNPDQFFWARCICGKEYIISHHTIMKKVFACKSCTMKEVGKMYYKPNRKARKRLNKIWSGMKRRCSPEHGHLEYGARGIKVCDEWLQDFPEGFEAFYGWSLTNGYEDNLTLERLDVNGNYCPENCKWISREDQDLNKRNTVYMEYKGEQTPLAQIHRELDSIIPYDVVYNRYNQGWSVERIFSTPYVPKKKGVD